MTYAPDAKRPAAPPGQSQAPALVDQHGNPVDPASLPGSIVIQQQQQQGSRIAPPRNLWDQVWAGALVLFAAPVLAFWMFSMGVGAIDRPDPDPAAAQSLHSAVIFIAAVALAWTIAVGPARIWRPLAYGAIGIPITAMMAASSLTEWDSGGFTLAILATLGLLVLAVLGGLWGWRLNHGDASDLAGAMTIAWTVPLAAVSIQAINTAESRAVEAATYYKETPGIGLVVLLVGLLALAWLRRR